LNLARRYLLSIVLALGITVMLGYSSFGDARIAVMISQRSDLHGEALASFLQAMIIESERTTIFTYALNGQMEAGLKIAEEIQRSKPDLVLAVGTTAALAAKKKLENIPIVFCMVLNPVSSGLVNSMNAPGGNITGASLDIPIETQFEYIKSIVADVKAIGVIYNPGETGTLVRKADMTARRMNMSLYAKPVYSGREVPGALKQLLGGVDVLWSVADGTVFPESAEYILLNTLRAGVPFMGISPSYVNAGALLALSCDYSDIGKQAAELAIRISGGENPGSIPVTVPRKVFLWLNSRTADQIGLSLSEQVIRSADKVIR
jgi:putative ABC transport system substrate-binding protein